MSPRADRPFPRMGAFVRAVRQAKGKKAKDLGIDPGTVTKVEQGANVYLEQYDKIARALGYRGVFDMLRPASPYDKDLRRLLKYWDAVRDDPEARRDVLASARACAADLAEEDATSGEG